VIEKKGALEKGGRMKFLYFSLVLSLLVFSLFYCRTAYAPIVLPEKSLEREYRFLMIDSEGSRTPYAYRTIIEATKAQGVRVDFVDFYNVHESGEEIAGKYDGIYLVCNNSFVDNREHWLVKKIVETLAEFSRRKNKFIGLFIPGASVVEESVAFFKTLTLDILFPVVSRTKPGVRDEMDKYLRGVFRPANLIRNFDTALLPFNAKRELAPYRSVQTIEDETIISAILPLEEKNYPLEYMQDMNFGFCLHSREMSNTLLVSRIGVFKGADPEEEWRYTPFDLRVKDKFVRAVVATIHDAIEIHRKDGFKEAISTKVVVPEIITSEFMKKEFREAKARPAPPRYRWVEEEKVFALWSDIYQYRGIEKKAAQDVFDSGANALWFNFNPSIFLGDRGYATRSRERNFETIRTFMFNLKKVYDGMNRPVPRIFLGMELMNNFHKAPVPEKAKDIYGSEYNGKAASPLDYKRLWVKECVEPLNRFVDIWNSDVGNGIPLCGVFLDFEMYPSGSLGNYTGITDFSDYSFNLFSKMKRGAVRLPVGFDEKIHYLYDRSLFDDYFNYLKSASFGIGRNLLREFKKAIPGCMVGVYNVGLPTNWFYLGLLRGLSSQRNPLLYFSFNRDFYSHKKWLEDRGIFAYHAPVFMLSKLEKEEDFEKISAFSSYNDGVWPNRWCWVTKGFDPDAWYRLEESSLPSEVITRGVRKQAMKMRGAPVVAVEEHREYKE
jgi:hypothetical protein